MKKVCFILLSFCLCLNMAAQNNVMDELKSDPRKAYGNDYPYGYVMGDLTKSPKGYKPFYISHYARHGSRYYWNSTLYKDLDTLLNAAHARNLLTAEGEAFYKKFEAAKKELMTGISELTQLGWEQHQGIARTMYNRFPEVFKKGGNVLAISSLSGRCVLSMSAFCQELAQCNPALEIREQSSRFTLDGVVPTDKENPERRSFATVRPRYEKNMSSFVSDNSLENKIISRVFTSTEGLPGDMNSIAGNLINLYTSLPNIYHEGMMGNIITDDEIVARWEKTNLGSYSWVYGDQYKMIPILEDIISKADGAVSGSNTRVADLRFGHDSCIGPLTVLMGINGADLNPEDPYEVKNCYQNWETCKACNIQLIFYRGKKSSDDVLVKCLLNGSEARLPMATDMFPYYRWNDVKAFYEGICEYGSNLSDAQQHVAEKTGGSELADADSVIESAINDEIIPGAVLCVVKDNDIRYLKAYGYRALVPEKEQMTTETIFDLASLSKCVGTTLSFMQLLEQGKIRLNDPVSRYIPGFKGDITIKHVMTHSSGLDAYIDNSIGRSERYGAAAPDSLMHYIATKAGRNFEPGSDFLYSCLNFVTVQNILQRVTGERLCDYAQKNVFDALGLEHTFYLPEDAQAKRAKYLDIIAPTEVQSDGLPFRGVVHDPLAQYLNKGNSGNAGVFSDARDLAVICSAIMNGGEYKGRRILSPVTVEKMCAVPEDIDPSVGRALGWDSYSSHAGIRGDLMSQHHCICHTGYTGTSIVMDLDSKVAVILLTNRVHPEDTGSLTRTRALIANVVASALL